MNDGLLSVMAGVAANELTLDGNYEFVGRFEVNPRAIIFRGSEDNTGAIATLGLQVSAYVGAGSVGSVDGRLYVGGGNTDFEFSILAGYTRGFFLESQVNHGFTFGGEIQFNPLFFWVNQPFWLALGYDVRCYDTSGFAPMHMVWAGLSVMLDWVWNPDRYAQTQAPAT